MVNEFTGGTYTYNLTNVPIVTIPGATIYNATSTISLPLGVTVSSGLTSLGFVEESSNYPTYTQYFTDYSSPTSSRVLVNFTASSSNFGLFQIDSVQRTISLAGDGSVLVTEVVTVRNFDTQDVSAINLTHPASGQFSLREGYVDGGAVSLLTGVLTLPVPISGSSLQSFVLQYTMRSSAVKDNGGTLTIDVGKGALNYTNMVKSYNVLLSFPSGTVAQASTPTSYVNQTIMPDVVLTAKVPLGWNIYLVTPALVGVLIAAVFLFFFFRRADLRPFEEEGLSIIKEKSDIVTSLLEQYRLRGEGFSSFDEFSAHRRSLEEERTKTSGRLQDYKAKAIKDKAQKAFFDRMAVEDVRLEQLYREGKVSLEERIAGRLSPKDFDVKMEALKASAKPANLLKEKPSK
jgi:hypothetical protein